MSYALFGPGGNGDWFRADGMKSALQTPGWLKSKGIDAFEYEATRGVNASEESLRAFGEKAREHGISVSLHASYFISLSSVEAEKRQNSVRYIVQATRAAEWIGAHTVVIHSGSTAKMPREEAMALSKNTLEMALEAVETLRSSWESRRWASSISWERWMRSLSNVVSHRGDWFLSLISDI